MLLDIMLPEMDGLEVCKALRRDPATSLLPIVMLTARAAEIDRVLGLELGADDYITKPSAPANSFCASRMSSSVPLPRPAASEFNSAGWSSTRHGTKSLTWTSHWN